MPDTFSGFGLLALQLTVEQVLAMKLASSCQTIAKRLQEAHLFQSRTSSAARPSFRALRRPS